MNNGKCNEEIVCSLFSILERLDKDGFFESFTQNDYDKAVSSMIDYFLRFKANKEKYEAFNADRPYGNFINIISKHPFSLIDFNEPMGDVVIQSDNGDGVRLTTKYAINFNSSLDVIKHKKNSGVVLDYDLNALNVALNYNYETEIMSVGESLNMTLLRYKILEALDSLILTSDVRVENILTVTSSSISDLCSSHPLMEDALEDSGVDKNTFYEFLEQNIKKVFNDSIRIGSIDNISFSEFATISDSPLYINDEPFLGNFYAKSLIVERLENEIVKRLEKHLWSVLFLSVDSNETEKFNSLLSEIKEQLSDAYGLIKEVVEKGVNNFQTEIDNVFISSIMQSQKGASLYATQQLSRSFSSINIDILNKHLGNKAGVSLSFDARYQGVSGGTVHYLPNFDKDAIYAKTAEIYTNKLNQYDPLFMEKYPATPDVIRFSIDFKKKDSSINILSFKEDYIKESVHTNDSMKYYMIDRSYLESGGHSLFVIDEGDSKPNGKMAMVFKAVAKKSDYCILASGTAVNGFPASIVPMLAYNGKMDIRTVAQNEAEFTRQCGVHEINSKLLGKILFSNNNKEFSLNFEKFYDSYVSIASKTGEGKVSANDAMKMIVSRLITSIMPLMVTLSIVEKSEISDIEVNKEAKKLKSLFDAMISVSKSVSLGFDALIKEALSNLHTILKLRPAISSPLTYVQMISSTAGNANITIQTREGLSGKKETKNILDFGTYEKNFMSGSKILDVDNFTKNNRLGARLAQVALRDYASVNFLHDTAVYLSDNFKFFVKNFTEQNKKINRELLETLTRLSNERGIFGDHHFSTGQVLTLMKKRTSSSSDSIDLMYKSYLDTNGKLRTLGEYKNMDDNKYNLFMLVLEIFDVFMKDTLLKLVENADATGKSVNNSIPLFFDNERYIFDMAQSNYFYLETFMSLDNEMETFKVVSSLENGYPNGFLFSIPVDMCPNDFKYIMNKSAKDMFLPFRINLKRREENQLFDSVGSLGYGKKIESIYAEGKSAVIASTRTAGTFFNLLATINAIVKGKMSNGSLDKIAIVLNEPSSSNSDSFNFKEAYSRINRELLLSNNIKIDKVRRNLLDSTVKGYRGDGVQTFVISNYESASRGLDLSSLDEIVVVGGMAKGKEGIQFSARLFSVKNQVATLSLFNGGCDATFMVPSSDKKQKLIADIFGNSSNEDKLCDIFSSLVSQVSSGLVAEESNKNTMKYMQELTGADEMKNMLVKTESGSVARLFIDKSNVYDHFMSGKSTSIDSATGKVESKENIEPIKFSVAYSPKKIEEKLQKNKQGIPIKI